jgi:hypothetical protein
MGTLQTIDVTTYGAVGDGVTDDTDAVQAAIATGGNVYFPAKHGQTNYVLSSQLTLSNGQAMYGDGFRFSRLLWDSGVSTGGAVNFGDYNMLRGLSFYGSDENNKHGLYTDSLDPSRMRCYDCLFGDFDDGVHLSGNCCFDFFGCYALSNVNGINIGETVTTNALNWYGGEIAQNTNAGILVSGAANRVMFSGATIEANTTYGFSSSGSGFRRNISLRDCYFESNGTAHVHCSATAQHGLIVDNCHFADTGTTKDIHISGGYYAHLVDNWHNDDSNTWIHIDGTSALYTSIELPYTEYDSPETWPNRITDTGWFTRYGFPQGLRPLTVNDGTPFIWQSTAGRTRNTSSTDYTDFEAGLTGQTFTFYVDDSYTTLKHDSGGAGSGPIRLVSGADKSCSAGEVYQFLLCDDDIWREITASA